MSDFRSGMVLVAALFTGLVIVSFVHTPPGPADRLTNAAAAGNPAAVVALLDLGTPVDVPDRDGKIALVRASFAGHADVVRILLERGADVNAPGRFGKTALMPASSQGHLEVARILLERGADVNARDAYNQTALMCAAVRGKKNVVKLLLESGADINARSRKGYSALSLASDQGRGHENIVLRKDLDILNLVNVGVNAVLFHKIGHQVIQLVTLGASYA